MGPLVLPGIAIILLILLWAERRSNSDFTGFRLSAADDSERVVRLPRATLLRQFLSAEDVAFAARLRSPAILRFVLRERQRLALEWLRITGLEAGRLYRLHVRAVRHATGLQPAAEAKLLVQVCGFWIVYELMCVMVRCYGPFRTHAFLRSVQGLGAILSDLSGHIAVTAATGPAPRAGAAGN